MSALQLAPWPVTRIIVLAGLCALCAAGCRKATPTASENRSEGHEDMNYAANTDVDEYVDTDFDSQTDSVDTCVTIIPKFPQVEYQPINLLFLLDRSSSMSEHKYGTASYENYVDSALLSLMPTPEYSPRNFGLVFFPAIDCQASSGDEPEDQCYPADRVNVPMGPETDLEIAEILETESTCGERPLCRSLRFLARDYFPSLPRELLAVPTFVVLITAGPPNCNSDLNPATCVSTNPDGTAATDADAAQCLDDECAVDAAGELFEFGIELFVVGIGDEVGLDSTWAEVMSELASSGSGGRLDYFSFPDPTELEWFLHHYFREPEWNGPPCYVDVDWDEVPDEPEVTKACHLVSVSAMFEGEEEPSELTARVESECGAEEGWFWQGMETMPSPSSPIPLDQCQTIELCPASCMRYKYEELTEMFFRFGCNDIYSP
jgi:hypothetical protein